MDRRKRRQSGPPLSVRCSEIVRVLRAVYRSQQLPDDDAGRDDADLVLCHLAHLPRGPRRMANFLDLWAPWMAAPEREEMQRRAATDPPPRFSADAIAARIGVTFELRQHLGLRTIGSTDVPARARKVLRAAHQKKLAAARQRKHRRSIGVRSRSEYLAASKSNLKPWEAAGVSRATWYRRTQSASGDRETGLAPQ